MIVPDLGSFITHYIPAKFVADDAVVLPPTRIVAFNPQLRINDGTLTGAIMRSHSVSYDEAERYVASSVWDIRRQLRERGAFELSRIGTLYLDVNGTYRFRPSDTAMPTPRLYALEPLLAGMSDASASDGRQQQLSSPGRERAARSDRYVFSINKDIANYVAAALVALVCLFTWNVSDAPQAAQSASVVSVQALGSSVAMHRAPEMVDDALASGYDELRPDRTDAGDNGSIKPYTVVLASAVSERNARDFVERLHASGIAEARVVVSGGQAQVVCGHYATASEAQTAAARLRTSPETRDCWVKRVEN